MIKCLIVDDEPLARKVIISHCSKFNDLVIVKECENAIQALEIIRTENIDLIFLDIQMPQITGMDLLKTLHNPPKIIITTAYREYAIEGYEFDVLDFLLKPISFDRFFKAIDKFYSHRQIKISANEDSIQQVEKCVVDNDDFILVKENKKMIKIFFNEILFIESLREYVHIHLVDNKIITKCTISSMEEILPLNDFIRIHKSFIISKNKIKAFTTYSVEINNQEIPIGRSYREEVLKILGYK